ncbi:MAG: response regulator [Oscillatoria princeps RMCB-10]|jgi:signal transduction histidine kinase/CheY-like chemotaxis protein|nr:response regulator [Oscillatoria princeps RMCB-10]
MNISILTVEVRLETDVVLARQRSRLIANLLGFSPQDQTRIATAVSELARNAFQYAGGGKVEFAIAEEAEIGRSARPLTPSPAQLLAIRISDRGPGISNLKAILDGQYTSPTGMGLGIAGARRLADRFDIESSPGKGTAVRLAKYLPAPAPPVTPQTLAEIAQQLAQRAGQTPLQEIQQQNQELLRTLDELRRRQEELTLLNTELDDTNRGVVALYAELNEKADFLQRANQLKSHFLANMSHEFRTPLNAILSLSWLLLQRTDGELTAEQEKQVGYMRKSAEALLALIDDLLDLAKVEAGKMTVRCQEFEVHELFSALRGMLKPLLSSNSSVALIFDEPAGLPPLNTDDGKLSQILRNFISNALKFTERGAIRVSAKIGPDSTALFSVADTGIGIAPEDREGIFQEFTQVESAVQKRVKGTGIGLPLSSKLAELLGGSISLESELGKGSTFSLTVPLVYAGAAKVQASPPVSQPIDPNRSPVLVVEDNRETLFIYEKYLQGSPFQIISARTVKEARAALQEFRPAAVMLDILLDGKSGWSLISEIKENPALRDIPAIVITLVDNQTKALELGADAFCLKPAGRDWLLSTLKTLTDRNKQKKKFLIIDDDEISRYLLKGLLADWHGQVLEAGTGSQGLALARQEKPQAIFMDLAMPEISGYEVISQLKSHPETREIPVIVNTSQRLQAEELKFLDRSCVAVIYKENISPQVALAKLEEALEKAGVNREQSQDKSDV